jgi:hypothetical protein
MTGDPTQKHDAGGQTATATAADAATSSAPEIGPDLPPGKARRRRRKKRRTRKDQIDIAKVLLAPVKLMQGARARHVSVFEATLRAQVAKAIDDRDSASIKALIDRAIEYNLVAPPAPEAPYCGVFVVPKGLCEADQREIFGPGTTMGRIVEIILRHYDKQAR